MSGLVFRVAWEADTARLVGLGMRERGAEGGRSFRGISVVVRDGAEGLGVFDRDSSLDGSKGYGVEYVRLRANVVFLAGFREEGRGATVSAGWSGSYSAVL